MDKVAVVAQIITFLERVRRTPQLYVGVHVDGLRAFLHGFNAACALLLNLETHGASMYESSYQAHGWEWSPRDAVIQMQEQGFATSAIMDEALAIEIDAWKRQYQLLLEAARRG